MSVKEKNIKINAVLNIVKTISSIIFPLITYPYILRVLQPENVGKINFSSSFINYFILIASLGVSTHAIRECSAVRNDRKKLEETASQIFSINMCSTMLSYIIMIVVLMFFREFDQYWILIMIHSFTIISVTVGCDWLNNVMEDFGYITLKIISFQILSLILMFLFVKDTNDYIIYTIISVIASSGIHITNVFYRKKYCNIKFTIKMNLKKHFKPILMLFVMILAQTIFSSSDMTMLGLMKGDFEVGLYSTAVKISNLISQVAASLLWVIMPRMTLYFDNENYENVNEMLKKILGALLILGLPCAIGAICLSKEIIWVIAGEEYLQASSVLCILMVSFLFSLFGDSFLGNMVLLPSKREKTYMKVCCIATVVNFVLNYFLIPIWGINAAAFTTAVSMLLMLILLLITKDKRIKINYIKDVIKAPLIGSFMIAVFCFIIKNIVINYIYRIVICILGSATIYFVILVLLKNELCAEILNLFYNKIKKQKIM